MNIKTDVKQQKRLDKFFAEENTWFPGNVGEKFLAVFFYFPLDKPYPLWYAIRIPIPI